LTLCALAGTRASWITEPDNYRRLVKLYRERKLSPDTERRELTGVPRALLVGEVHPPTQIVDCGSSCTSSKSGPFAASRLGA
jgi:hypothetical protein